MQTCNDSRRDFHKLCRILRNCQCKWLLASFRVPGTFTNFSGFLVKFFCTDTPGSIEWLNPAPRLHIDDCFEIRNCRSGPCNLLFSSHQNLQHEVQLRHCVFCTGPLYFLVRLQISQFRSSGKWVWTLCLLTSSRLLNIGSKEASLEKLAREPPCNGISSSTKFSWIPRSHSGISRSNRLLRSIVVFFLIIFGTLLAWVPQVSPIYHQIQTLTVSHIFPFSNQNFAYCRWRRWRMKKKKNDSSCFIGVREVDEDPEDELDKSGTTIGTKFSVLQIIRIPFLMRCGFWSLIHS